MHCLTGHVVVGARFRSLSAWLEHVWRGGRGLKHETDKVDLNTSAENRGNANHFRSRLDERSMSFTRLMSA